MRLGAPSAAPPRPPQLRGLPGVLLRFRPLSGCSPPTPGLPLCSRERASERAIESQPASQPASLRAAGCRRSGRAGGGDHGGWHPGAKAARRPPRPGNAQRAIPGKEGCCSWGHLLQLRGRRGSGEGGARRECRTLQIGWGRPRGAGSGGGQVLANTVITLLPPTLPPAPSYGGSCALRGREEGRGEGAWGDFARLCSREGVGEAL